tara:strand:- start:9453 stop:10742 length:1290 start_codon:yes stop_codon:yes gene_type:complete
VIKAMSFPTIPSSIKNIGIEALYDHNVSSSDNYFETVWLLENVRNASRDQVSRNAQFILSMPRGDSRITDYYPDLEQWMFLGLFDALGTETLYSIATIFSEDPYEFRKGWPDITMWKGNKVRFLEVKAPGDKVHKSQWIINRRFNKPLSLDFAIVDVQPYESAVATFGQPRLTRRHGTGSGDSPSKHIGAERKKPEAQSIAKNTYWRNANDANTKSIQAIEHAWADIQKCKQSSGSKQNLATLEQAAEITNQYYADMKQAIRSSPNDGLTMALRWQPTPSLHEAIGAIRALVREKRKARDDYADELFFLYALAAVNSFTPPRAEKRHYPGTNIRDTIPRVVFGELMIDYNAIGYEKLKLLNLSDIRLITTEWGEPSRHSTLYEYENHVWKEWEERYWKTASPGSANGSESPQRFFEIIRDLVSKVFRFQ